ncbi:class I SAM-dependent methyltransferase [Alkalicoccus saliphilus]|jgi:site-specific DNA-methyltransferase (adenine-specific)|uniref:Class I SAM-dependent methyltransferase n=1 Tax=Alkalicoccus saliphilus TaxID=200989 RepID=A0A2T4U8W2_9BACI|nr:class I SAM-dependent methyltransferase [Alkalicoccus saliphilus]PTL39842.1 class I SAM-dependent methyltransferase [Alkalicoccus saliphilus]
MEESTNTEKYHHVLDQGAELLQKEEDSLYLEALGSMGEILFQQEIPENFSSDSRKKLTEIMQQLPSEVHREEIRRAVQLAVLKGMKEATQPHHALTPDAVALFIGYLLDKILTKETEDPLVIFDPAAGAGNLMTAALNQLSKNAHFIGAEPDETLLKLAYVNANLQEHSVDLFHQDSVSSPAVDNLHAVVSDLPAGYYPDDKTAADFKTAADSGHTYVHHLLIEKSLQHVREGGFLIFLIPNGLFQSEQADKLQEMLKQKADIYSVLQLPQTMFKSREAGKSILILRRKKQGIVPPKQALLAELPSFTREAALADMMQRISAWFDEHL